MRVLVACEFSGVVRRAFRSRGHEAWSCDIRDSLDDSEHHFIRNVLEIIDQSWDLMIAHPPCRYLAVSGSRWWPGREREQEESLDFVRALMDAPVPRICIENPVSCISTRIRPASQYTHPWQFGHGYKKKTGLWLKNLPLLVPTRVVPGRHPSIHMAPDSKGRSERRSITPEGIAEAMADQWGSLNEDSL